MDSSGLYLYSNQSQLVRLKRYLNYHISSFLLFAFSFFSIILIFLLTAAALIFIPYIFFVLYRNQKYGWLIALILMVLLPVIILVLLVAQTYTLMVLLLIELAVFYFYCFTLRIAVNNWVKEINQVNLINFQRKRRCEQQNDDFSF